MCTKGTYVQDCLLCFGDFITMRTLCDTYHEELKSLSLQSWTYLLILSALTTGCQHLRFDILFSENRKL